MHTITFAGREWVVKDSADDRFGPGPNYWSADNVRIDEDGLHLSINRKNRSWYCAEIYTEIPLGFGDYTFTLFIGFKEVAETPSMCSRPDE
jgi:hypothetical protein